MNPSLTMYLADISDSVLVDRSEVSPTSAAQRMLELEHTRAAPPSRGQNRHGQGGRLRPMPAETRATVLTYLDERLALFTQAKEILSDSRWGQRAAKWQLKRLAKLRDLLIGAWREI
jgi:hypothetical protein